MMESARTATRPASRALEKRRTSVQSVQMVCQSLTHIRCLHAATAVSHFRVYTAARPALFQWWCLLLLPPPGRFLTTQQTCVSKCPGGFFASRLSGVCEACPPGCLQCVDAQHCTRCQSSRKTPLFLQDGQCVQQCVRSGVRPIAVCFVYLVSNANVFTCFF